MTKAAPLAVISTLPIILGCALLGAREARADPFVVTIDQEGPNVVARSNLGGAIDISGLGTPTGPFTEQAQVWPATRRMQTATGPIEVFNVTFSGPPNFGSGNTQLFASSSVGSSVGIAPAFNDLNIPAGYSSGNAIAPTLATWNGATFATLGITPGLYTWTWLGGSSSTERSFTINAVPGPIVGAGLPGLIAALGGLVAMARRRRKQLA